MCPWLLAVCYGRAVLLALLEGVAEDGDTKDIEASLKDHTNSGVFPPASPLR